MTFDLGDVVQLKSGGPMMTVTSLTDNKWVNCRWFFGEKLESGCFPPQALDKEDNGEDEADRSGRCPTTGY